MQLINRTFITSSILAAALAFAPAQEADKVNQTLLRATSPFEDMVEFALAKNTASMTKALTAADNTASGVKAVLTALAPSKFDSLVQAIHQSAAENKHHAVAANAVEVFRLLIDNLQADGLKEPREVSLLDYAGFKSHVLAAAQQPDWEAMRKTVADAATWWDATKAKVSERRVESRQHHPQDVVAGAGIGILSSYIFTKPYKGWRVSVEGDTKSFGVRLVRHFSSHMADSSPPRRPCHPARSFRPRSIRAF